MPGQAFLQHGHVKLAGRVVEGVVLPGAPLEEGPHRHEVGELAAEGQGLAVVLAVVVEPALVAFEQGLGDLGRLRDAAVLAPGDEGAEVMLPARDGVLRVVLDPQPFEEGYQCFLPRRRQAIPEAGRRLRVRCKRVALRKVIVGGVRVVRFGSAKDVAWLLDPSRQPQ